MEHRGERTWGRLVPTLGADPARVLRHFERRGLFVVRFFNATKHGKSQKRPAGRQFPLDSAKERGKACLPRARPLNRHAGVCRRASPARKFEAQLPQSRGENHAQNAIEEPQFCRQQRPIGWMIRSGNTTINHNIVSIYIFGVFSSLVTNRLVHCSSHILSHRPRPFFAIFDTG